jgi:ABC-2 type transport system ATP-binding protein
MKDDVAIKVHDLHKSFDIAENKSTSIKQLFVNVGKKNKKRRQKVLEGIDFEVKKGEFFGIVGRNGSGKSTLLKLLAGVYTPDKGAVEINGNLTPFIELGVGFNPELSGRDNVYLSASLLGFTRKQVDLIYEDIVNFAELHEHMDKKLKNYSSGMQVRLAFSIAVKAKNDILIFDEVLAVGDEAFQRKCINIFEEYKRNKQTVILVTHSMGSVRSLCTRALMLSDGKIELIGSVEKVSNAYLLSNSGELNSTSNNTSVKKTNTLKIAGNKTAYNMRDEMNFKISWSKDLDVKWVGVSIIGSNGEYVFGSNTGDYKLHGSSINHSIKLNIGPGRYSLIIAIKDADGNLLEIEEQTAEFLVFNDSRDDIGGLTRLEYSYSEISDK